MIEGRTILCFASGYDAPPTNDDRNDPLGART